MRLKHRFWQILALSLSTLALERQWVAAGFGVAFLGWLAGIAYVLMGG
ncbi:MAG TPA: hypothetical protein VF707_00935 [Ardenticatenaceae bacterium]|jgi:hypothetical protein